MKKNTRSLVFSALVAALYVVFSLPMMSFGFGAVQFRLSEVLTILPYFSFASVPGLFVGCLLTNIMGVASGLTSGLDIIFGSLATLLAASASYFLRKRKWLVPLPPVVINALIIGLMLYLTIFSSMPLWMNIAYVALGQAVVCYGLGMPMLFLIEKSKLFEKLPLMPKNK